MTAAADMPSSSALSSSVMQPPSQHLVEFETQKPKQPPSAAATAAAAAAAATSSADDDGRGVVGPDHDRISGPVIVICIAIVSVLLFQSITPAESYLHEYLQTEKHIDRDQMHHNIWPMYTYSQFAALIPLTIAAERFCHYPPIIVLSIVLRLISSLIHDLSPMEWIWPHQLSLGLFGIACAGKVAFRSFVYSVLPNRVYFLMTSYTRGANSAAHVIGSLLGWGLKRLHTPWPVFFRIQQACLGIALLSFLIGLYISNRSHERRHPSSSSSSSSSSRSSIWTHDQIQSLPELLHLIRSIYSCPRLVVYSMFTIAAGAVFEVVMMNATTLFHKIDPSAAENGLVFGAGKCLAASITIFLSRYSRFLERNGYTILLMESWIVSASLLISYLSRNNIAMAYLSLILTCISYDICFCISMTLIASSLPSSLRGLAIFSNTVASLALQSAIQALLKSLGLDIHHYYLSFTIIFVVIALFLHAAPSRMKPNPVVS